MPSIHAPKRFQRTTEAGGQDHAPPCPALLIVLQPEAWPVHILRLVLDRDAAQFRGRGMDLMIDVDLHVLVFRHHPFRSQKADMLGRM